MGSFDLDTKLMQFGTGDGLSHNWCIKHSVIGVQCFGSNGSGKSSSMRTLALKYLRAGYGFLVLSAKPERETWEEYCKLAGRTEDLKIIGEDSPHRFDVMRYLSQQSKAGSFAANLVNILYKVIETMDETQGGKSADPFWEKSVRMLLHNTITICQLAHDRVSIQGMYDIIQTAPQLSEDGSEMQDNPESAFNKAFESIRQSIQGGYEAWKAEWNEDEKIWFENKEMREAAILEKFPKARLFKLVDQFFNQTFKALSNKTRSIVLFSVSSFLFHLLQDPAYSIFCSGKITCQPNDCLDGSVIVLDLPTKIYHEVGRSVQLLFKYIAQLEWEKRDVKLNDRIVCLWQDENHIFLTEYDQQFNSTARSSLCAVVAITQNMHSLLSAMGGAKSADRVARYLATLNTRFYFSNACTTTNNAASELIGDAIFYEPSRTITYAEKFSQTDSISLKTDRLVPAYRFSSLKTGGNANGGIVEAYMYVQGDPLFSGRNYKKIRFNQNYK